MSLLDDEHEQTFGELVTELEAECICLRGAVEKALGALPGSTDWQEARAIWKGSFVRVERILRDWKMEDE
jgi:hypothetical protein